MDLISEPVLINHPADTLIIFLPPVFSFTASLSCNILTAFQTIGVRVDEFFFVWVWNVLVLVKIIYCDFLSLFPYSQLSIISFFLYKFFCIYRQFCFFLWTFYTCLIQFITYSARTRRVLALCTSPCRINASFCRKVYCTVSTVLILLIFHFSKHCKRGKTLLNSPFRFQVPVHRPETSGWARFSSPSVADYSTPLARSPRPSLTAHCSPASRRPPFGTAGSLGSLQSSLVCDTSSSRPRVVAIAPTRHHLGRSFGGGAVQPPPPPRYTNCDNGGARSRPPPPPVYPDYEYSAPGGVGGNTGCGEASPYSVSSELYKHVLPQYFPLSVGRPGSRGSVLV